jgi:hypothetical protein
MTLIMTLIIAQRRRWSRPHAVMNALGAEGGAEGEAEARLRDKGCPMGRMQWSACNGPHAMVRMQWSACNGPHATDRMQWSACNGPHAMGPRRARDLE